MKRAYDKIKAPFLELEKDLGRNEQVLLRNAKYFLAFCIFMITSVLIYYSSTKDGMVPFFALGITAAVFWTHSDRTGKIFMVAAASIGYVHEVVGGMEGWFVYTSGEVYQTPLWLIFGYAAMYWSCYNLWKVGSKKYKLKERNFLILAACVIAGAFIIDATLLHFRPTYWPVDMISIAAILLLFRKPGERHFALVAWLLTAYDEFLGFSLGAWQHYLYAGQVSTLAGHVDITAPAATGFSFTGLTPPYMLFLWGSIRFAEYVQEKKRPIMKDAIICGVAVAAKTYTWLSSSFLLAALTAGKLL